MYSRHTRRSAGWLIVVLAALMTLVIAAPAAAKNPPGNNGTVKIHDEFEAEPIVRNEPHVVCDFHIHFFFADSEQQGAWWIESWPPTGSKETVLSGEYTTNDSGEYATILYTLPGGHYKLFWNGRNEQNVKHKAFWVEPCPPTPNQPTNPPNQPNQPNQPEGNLGGGSGTVQPRASTAASTGGPGVKTLPDTAMPVSSLALSLAVILMVSGAGVVAVAIRRDDLER